MRVSLARRSQPVRSLQHTLTLSSAHWLARCASFAPHTPALTVITVIWWRGPYMLEYIRWLSRKSSCAKPISLQLHLVWTRPMLNLGIATSGTIRMVLSVYTDLDFEGFMKVLERLFFLAVCHIDTCDVYHIPRRVSHRHLRYHGTIQRRVVYRCLLP